MGSQSVPGNTKSVTSLGLLGRYYSVRHTLGQYSSVSVIATIQTTVSGAPDPRKQLCDAFERSVQATIDEHPGLCYGLSHKTANSVPLFEHAEEINFEDVIKYVEAESSEHALEGAEELLCREVEAAHGQFWCVGKPAWRTIVVLPNDRLSSETSSSLRINVAFIFHHAIADGLSGVAFQRTLTGGLAKFLPENGLGSTQWPMRLSTPRPVPPLIDDSFNFIQEETVPPGQHAGEPVWAGNAPTQLSVDVFKSKMRLLTLQPHEVAQILRACKQNGVTLTSLLHAVICTSLARAVPSAPGFRAATPYSLRGFTGTSPREIVNHVSYGTQYASASVLKALRQSIPHSAVENEHVIQLARDFGREIQAEVARFPKDNAWSGIAVVDDLEAHCRAQFGKERTHTYELSNIGGVATANADGGAAVTLEKLIFTQCGSLTGPPLAFNCVSIRGGPLTITITWQEGVVEDLVVDAVRREMTDRLVSGFGAART